MAPKNLPLSVAAMLRVRPEPPTAVRKRRAAMMMMMMLGAAAFLACTHEEASPGPEASAESVLATQAAGVPEPADNPANPSKVELGRLLFWDPILAGDRDIACGSCHDPARGYSDGRKVSIGTGGAAVARNALTVLDAAWNGWTALTPAPAADAAPMFWDNRAQSLEVQAVAPILAADEMRGKNHTEATIFPEVVARLRAIPGYVDRFDAAFPNRPSEEAGDRIAKETIVRAIAAFERTLVSRPSYERWLAGDESALSAAAQRGVADFRRAGCSACHSGPMLSDFALHRFQRGGEAIRTPSLRNVLRTAPYMHDGRAATIGDVLNIYRRVDRDADPAFEGLRIPGGRGGGDASDLQAFLAAASDGTYDETIPTEVPSGLPVGGRIRAE